MLWTHAHHLLGRCGAFLQVFERGNFAGLEDMKHSPRLFDRVAPLGVNDIIMAVSYQHSPQAPLPLPITCFEGALDQTVDPGNMPQWSQYTTGTFRIFPVQGDHYFVSKMYRQVRCLPRLIPSQGLLMQRLSHPLLRIDKLTPCKLIEETAIAAHLVPSESPQVSDEVDVAWLSTAMHLCPYQLALDLASRLIVHT